MTTGDLYNRLQFICDKAAQEGATAFDILGALQLVIQVTGTKVIKVSERSPIVPIRGQIPPAPNGGGQ